MTQLYLLRHGETDFNRERRLQGRLDIPLNEVGEDQARDAAAALHEAGIVRIVCSPLERCVKTAEIIAEKLGGLPIRQDDRLIERDFGGFSNRTVKEICAEVGIDKLMLFEDQHFPANAEKMDHVAKRAEAAVDDILAWDEPTLIVSHAGIFWELALSYTGQPMIFPNATPHRLLPKGASWQLLPITGQPEDVAHTG